MAFLIRAIDGELGVEEVEYSKSTSLKELLSMLECNHFEVFKANGHMFYVDELAKVKPNPNQHCHFHTVVPLTSNPNGTYQIIMGNILFHRTTTDGKILKPNKTTDFYLDLFINDFYYLDRGVDKPWRL